MRGMTFVLFHAALVSAAGTAAAEKYQLEGTTTFLRDPENEIPDIRMPYPIRFSIEFDRKNPDGIDPVMVVDHFTATFFPDTPSAVEVDIPGESEFDQIFPVDSQFTSGVTALATGSLPNTTVHVEIRFKGPENFWPASSVPDLSYGGWNAILFEIHQCGPLGCSEAAPGGFLATGFIHTIQLVGPPDPSDAALTSLVESRSSQTSVDALAAKVTTLQGQQTTMLANQATILANQATILAKLEQIILVVTKGK